MAGRRARHRRRDRHADDDAGDQSRRGARPRRPRRAARRHLRRRLRARARDRRRRGARASSIPTTTPTSSPARARSPRRSCASAPTPIDAIFVPVGGGGLIAGIAAYVKPLFPEVRVIGVEPEDSNCAARGAGRRRAGRARFACRCSPTASPCAGRRRAVPRRARVRRRGDPGQHRRDLRRDQGHLRGHARHRRAGRRARRRRAQALGRARAGARDRTLVAIESGANLNFDRLRYISERTETGAHAEVLLAVTIPEEKGSFRRFCGVLQRPRDHRVQLPLLRRRRRADIFVGLKVSAGDAERRAPHRGAARTAAIRSPT